MPLQRLGVAPPSCDGGNRFMENNKLNAWNQFSTAVRVQFNYQRSISIVFFLCLLLTINVHADQCLGASNPITGQVYQDGDVVDCYVSNELVVGPTVTAESGAMLILSAPSVIFNGPVSIQEGAILSVHIKIFPINDTGIT